MKRTLESSLSSVYPDIQLSSLQQTCTLWYNQRSGTVYGIGKKNPHPNKKHYSSVTLLWDNINDLPKPELVSSAKITRALEKALEIIKIYRHLKLIGEFNNS